MHNTLAKQKKNGFTLLEILLVIALLGMIAGLVYASFSALNNRQILNAEVDNIKSIIQITRLESLNSKNGSTHRIIFDATTVTTAETGTTTIKVYTLSPSVIMQGQTLKQISNGAATSSVSFAKLTGLANATGTVTYIFNGGSAYTATKTITINALGTVE